MSFMDAVKTCFSKYADFKGRASRAEYWWFFLSYIIAYIVVVVIGSAVKSLYLVLIIALLLAYLLPTLAAAVRRLHDTGKSGWWYFIALIPLVGPILLIVFLATQGQPAPNQYGPPPGGGSAMAPPPPPPPPIPS
jgi:uncharacterized membrane protein YhaH (DUF805 family)